MYEIKKSPFGDFDLYRVENTQTGNGFSIVPEIGGTVLDIWFDGRSILDGYETPEELAEGKWGKSAILFPFPNRMRDGNYQWNGQTFSFPINSAPTNNAIHGFVRHEAFTYATGQATEHTASLTIAYEYDGHLAWYPFAFTLKITFRISDDQAFQTEVSVTNHHTAAIPIGFGWHPYFRITEKVADTLLYIPVCEKVGIDDRMLPNGTTTIFDQFNEKEPIGDTFLDNCFLANADYTLSIETDGRQLSLKAPAQQFPYFQVFTPPHRTSVALEPMSCNVDAFNNKNGLVELGAGETWSGEFIIVIS